MENPIYPNATKETAQKRRQLAPRTLEAFKAFSDQVFAEEELMEAIGVAAEMRAGGAYAHSTLAIEVMHQHEAK